MAKHITKSVIEDIAYELKRLGLWYNSWQMGDDTEEPIDNPEKMLNSAIEQIAEVLASHDPTFDREKFMQQCEYKISLD